MGTKFTATKIDLELELTTLKGEEITLDMDGAATTTKCISIIEQWGKIEEDHNSLLVKNNKLKEAGKEPLKEKVSSSYELLALQLSLVYPKDAKWFMDNFEPQVLLDIVNHVVDSIKTAKKKLRK